MTAMPIRAFFRSVPFFALVLLAACGFHLRGSIDIPYTRLYIASPEVSTSLGAALRRQIRAHQPDILVETGKDADAIFRQVSTQREREITVLNADGRAREYQLRLFYSFRVETPAGQPLMPVSSILLTREIIYDDNQVLSKAQEEGLLWQDMERDLIQQIMRRLASMKPLPAPKPNEKSDAEGENVMPQEPSDAADAK